MSTPLGDKLVKAFGELGEVLARRAKAQERIAIAIAHLPRERQLEIIMSFISIEDLEHIADFQERET